MISNVTASCYNNLDRLLEEIQASDPAKMKDLNELLKLIQPYYCRDKVRIGSNFDGGYVLPAAAIEQADALLSFGIATNIDFEKHIARVNKGIMIMMFDPFTGPVEDLGRLIKRPFSKTEVIERIPVPEINPFFKEVVLPMPLRIMNRVFFWADFYRRTFKKSVTYKKLGLRDYCDDRFINFPSLFSMPPIAGKNSIIIKMDIELDEYKVWRQLLPFLPKVAVIAIEVHQVGKFYPELMDMITAFKTQGMYPVHIHGNNVDNLIEGSEIPNCLEITFSKEKYCTSLTPDKRKYPDKDLDAPCNPKWLDYELPQSPEVS